MPPYRLLGLGYDGLNHQEKRWKMSMLCNAEQCLTDKGFRRTGMLSFEPKAMMHKPSFSQCGLRGAGFLIQYE